MEVSECFSIMYLMIAKTIESIQCIFCNDDSCIKIIINNFSTNVI